MLPYVISCVLGPESLARDSEGKNKGQTRGHRYREAEIRWGGSIATGNSANLSSLLCKAQEELASFGGSCP